LNVECRALLCPANFPILNYYTGKTIEPRRMNMNEMEIFLRMAFAGLGLILTILTLASWFRTRESKILLAGVGFGMLAAEGLLLAVGIFFEDFEAFNTILTMVGLSFLAMVFLYLSILKR
jgi:hypothetical protein